MKKKHIPWDIIIKHFKREASVDEEAQLNAWRAITENEDVFETLRILWLSIIKEGTEYVSHADKLWQRMNIRINGVKKDLNKKEKVIRVSLNKLRLISVAASIILTICFSFSWYLIKQSSNTNNIAQFYTTINGKSKVVLPDGSEVWLNSNSSLEYKTNFWNRERSVFLTGEAYFDVAKDDSRPFIVKNQGFRVKVYGTTFNVKAFENNNSMEVSLLSGSIDVSSANDVRMMVPGETAVCMKNTGKISVEKTDVNFIAVWAKDSIRFERKSIKELVKYLSRWYGVKFVLDSSISENQAYTFTVKNEPLEEILRLMAHIHLIKYSFDNNNQVTIYSKYK